MATKESPKVEKICWNCRSRTAPAGDMFLKHWCNNPKSEHANSYINKGETCKQFKAAKISRTDLVFEGEVHELHEGEEKTESVK